MIQLIPRVHSKTIVGLITLILFIPLITCAPFIDKHPDDKESSSRNGHALPGEAAHFESSSNNDATLSIAPPVPNYVLNGSSTINDLGTKSEQPIDIDESVEEGNGQRPTRRIESPPPVESASQPIQESNVLTMLKTLPQYEIRINPAVEQYNESTYKVVLHATLVKKLGDEPPRELLTLEEYQSINPFKPSNYSNFESQPETFAERDLERNISDSSSLNNEYPVDNSTSIAIAPLNGTLSNVGVQYTTSNVASPSSILVSTVPTKVSVISDKEITVTPPSSPVTSNLDSSRDLVKNSRNLSDPDSSKKERVEKTDPIITVTKTPSICDKKSGNENSPSKANSIAESNSVKSSTTTEAPKPEKKTPSSIEERMSPISPSSFISATTPIPISGGTVNQTSHSTIKLDSTREYNPSTHTVHEHNYLSPGYARPAPETEWKPEGVRLGPVYLMAPGANYVEPETNDRATRNDQVKPSRTVKPPINRQNERPQHRDNQRQVSPNQFPPSVASYNLPPPLPPSAPGRNNYNQESNSVGITRKSPKPPAWNPVGNINHGQQPQYQGQRGVHYAPQQAPARPIAIEEIVHSRGSRFNKQNQIEPELFMRIIRHYFVNAWAPREDRFVFERREPIMQPESRSSQGINRNQYQT